MTHHEINKLAYSLKEEEIQQLFSTLIIMNKVCIPQFYTSDSDAEAYGFDDLRDMNEKTEHYYEKIDEDMYMLSSDY